jgi:cyclopropane fatty-acyl-phospholipid synthase-like methyltransferase
MRTVADYVKFDDGTLARKWAGKRVPISDVYEAYLDGKLDIPDQTWDEFFDRRSDIMSFRLTSSHVKWALTNFLPEVTIHSLRQDKKIVSEHYDRGNDFFEWFLGDAMVYTAAWFESPEGDLEEAQYRKIDRCCEKLQVKKGETLLDIGCGWGTFVTRAAANYGAKAHGVTLAKEQVAFGTNRIRNANVQDIASVEVRDYRAVTGKFDKIVSLEMIEHVGVKNLDVYFQKVHELLSDDGAFVLQWTGIRNLYSPQNPFQAFSLRSEDLIWGLFMSRFIFPGADASLPLSAMLRAAEKAGFEIAHVDRMSAHYALTIRAWRQNWLKNKDAVVAKYGQRWFRLWNFFLHWSAIIADQGTGLCYQVTMHKDHEAFDRKSFAFPQRAVVASLSEMRPAKRAVGAAE